MFGDCDLNDSLWRVACVHPDRAEAASNDARNDETNDTTRLDDSYQPIEQAEARAVPHASYCSSYMTTVRVPSLTPGVPWEFELEIFDVTSGVGGVLWAGAIVAASWISSHPQVVAGRKILELGSGTGLTGMAAARAGAMHVDLSDYVDELVLGLHESIARAGLQDVATTRKLDWSDYIGVTDVHRVEEQYDVILGIECVYNCRHGPALVATIEQLLLPSGVAYIIAKHGRVGLPEFINAVEASSVLQICRRSMMPKSDSAEAQQYYDKDLHHETFHLIEITLSRAPS